MTPGGFLLVLAIVLPVCGVLVAMAFGGRATRGAVLALLPVGLAIALAVLWQVAQSGAALAYHVGGWAPPLGITLRADGLAAVMMVMSAVVIGAIALFARDGFPGPDDGRAQQVFWIMLLAIWAALNTVWLSGDLFNLYVALELLTFSAVPLVCLEGKPETIAAALRYMLFALLGSVLYLLGVVLLYGAYGALDIATLAARVRPEPVVWIAGALMTVGLLAKTALFPLHLWLPPAHGGAPPAASAVLSALVVKGSFFLVLRLWFDVLGGMPGLAAGYVLGALGAAAILVGSALALRQARLKLLIAYSTLGQLGYLFPIFPLALGRGDAGAVAWTAGTLQLVSHAVAKAAMFMSAGLIAEAVGHDRIAGLRGVGRALPVTVFAFALAGMSLMGLPPSGGFVAKLMLLTAAVMQGQWWWGVVILLGGLLAGGYLYRVLAPALAVPAVPLVLQATIPARRQAVVLALAIGALLLGTLPLRPLEILQVGRPALVAVAK